MDIQALQSTCRQVRRDIITMTNKAGAGHPGGSLSCTEALVALYFDVMNIDPQNEKDPNRDRFVLSKGHAAPALYGTLCRRGFFGPEEYDKFRQLHVPRCGCIHRLSGPGYFHCCGYGAGCQEDWQPCSCVHHHR